MFDLGIQTPEGRSPLYRLLMNFSPITPDLYHLKNAIREGMLKTTTSERVIYPRVVFGNWTLMRQQWKLLDFGDLIENWNFFSRFWEQKKFQNEFNEKIAHQFYLKTDQQFKQKKSKKRTFAKPIYVDFENPILFNLLKKYNELNKKIYEITEMLPQKDHLLKIKQETFFVECIFEWHIKS